MFNSLKIIAALKAEIKELKEMNDNQRFLLVQAQARLDVQTALVRDAKLVASKVPTVSRSDMTIGDRLRVLEDDLDKRMEWKRSHLNPFSQQGRMPTKEVAEEIRKSMTRNTRLDNR